MLIKGESIVGCAIRELKEETGISMRCKLPPPPPETTHQGVNLSYSDSLDTPVAFAAADAVTRDEHGNIKFHYALIEVRPSRRALAKSHICCLYP
eukprot:scaffold129406_cov50-Prasinocladus_malaysianus.AAC.1